MLHRLAALLLLTAPAALATVVPSVFGGRIPCTVKDGVQFCAGTMATRVESWDGVPLDVNVTIPPAAMNPPPGTKFPMIVDLHGWGGAKAAEPFTARAMQGFVVLSPTARGFHGSCGSVEARQPDPSLPNPNICTEKGWTHLADARYEARDVQHLAGLLADEGLIDGFKIGVTGISYGGGQSFILGALKLRVMLPDGTLIPWKSPHGKAMCVIAAAPLIGWTDLAYALTPNGRTLDFQIGNPYGARAGVQKQSWNDLLYTAGLATGYYAPPGVDPSADLTTWNARVAAGEPYDADAGTQAMLDEITHFHSAYYIDDSEEPAAFFAYNAWTDDLFPAEEALRYWRKEINKHTTVDFSLHFADGFGHPRANLSSGNLSRVTARVDAFFARVLKEMDTPKTAVETFTQACGGSTEDGPFTATSWDALHPGEVRYTGPRSRQQFDQTVGAEATATATNPVNFSLTPCRTVAAATDPHAATYLFPAVAAPGFTLLGSPTIIADLIASSDAAQVAARLWDVAPDSTQSLVSHTFYRPRTDNRGPQVFQLHPNGWKFAAGHIVKLELLGQSVPFGRASRLPFRVQVNNLELRLPVLESPGGSVQAPLAAPTVIDAAEAPACPSTPTPTCRAPSPGGAARLTISRGRRTKLAWPGGRGALSKTEIGAAIAGRGFTLCAYNGTGLLTSASAPPTGACTTSPCWKTTAKSSRSSKEGTARSGLRMILAAAAAGTARITIASAPGQLIVPTLPLANLPITVQLHDGAGNCWGGALPTVTANTAKRLVAKSKR